jgi:hypothetical protein
MDTALYTTLEVFAKSLGVREVAAICQRFILNSIPLPVPVPVPVPVSVAPVIAIAETPIEAEPEADAKPHTKKFKVFNPRNFKKIAQETNYLPFGTVLITASTDKYPTAYGTVVRNQMGVPAIQPAWDKSKFFTGTSSPPVAFLKELNKHFKVIPSDPFNTENAWNDVYKRNTDGTNISLTDIWKQL